MAKRQPELDRALLLRDGVYHLNRRTPKPVLQLYPEEPEHVRVSLDTSSIYEARERRDRLMAELDARWAAMLAGDPIAAEIKAEAAWREKEGLGRTADLPWPGVSEKLEEQLKALADQLGLREELEAPDTQDSAWRALRRHPVGARLTDLIDTAAGRLTWSEAGELFLAEGTVRESTAAHYRNVWATADRLSLTRPDLITRRQAREYLERRRDDGLTHSSLNSIRGAMTNVMEKLYPDTDDDQDRLRRQLWKGHKVPPKVDKKGTRKRPIEPHELATVLEGMHWSVSVATKLACYSGLRMGELYTATWDLKARVIRVPEGKTKASERTIPLHPHIQAEAERWVSDDTRYTKATLRDAFSKRKRALGLPKAISFHSTRHAFNTALARAGVTKEIRELLLGHEITDTNSVYTHLTLEDLRGHLERVDWTSATPHPWNAL